MPAHHTQRRPVVVANARHSPLWLRFASRPDAFRARCSVAPEQLSPSEPPNPNRSGRDKRVGIIGCGWVGTRVSAAPLPKLVSATHSHEGDPCAMTMTSQRHGIIRMRHTSCRLRHSPGRRTKPCQHPSRSRTPESESPEGCSGYRSWHGECCWVRRSSICGYLLAPGAHRRPSPCPYCPTANDGRWTPESSSYPVRPPCYWHPLARWLPGGGPGRVIEHCSSCRLPRGCDRWRKGRFSSR